MTIYAHTDGASRGNPGESGIGVVLRNEAGQVLQSISAYIGSTTNNVAEYTALIECLKKALKANCTKLIVNSDSELIVRQVQGRYRVRDANLKKYYETVRRHLASAPFKFEIRYVPREQNRDADLLANSGIDSKSPKLRWSIRAQDEKKV